MAVTFELITQSGTRKIAGRQVTSAAWDVVEDGGYGTCELEYIGSDPPQVGDCLTIRSDSTPLYRGWCERVEASARDGVVGYKATFAGLYTRMRTAVLNRRYAAKGGQTDVGYAAQAFLRVLKSVNPSLPLSSITDYIDTSFGITLQSADWLFVSGEQALRTLRDKCIDGVLVGFGAGATKDSNYLIFRKVAGQTVSWYLSTRRRWVQVYERPVELGEVVNSLKLICGQSQTPNLLPNGAFRQVSPSSPGAANLLSDPGFEYFGINADNSPWRGAGSPVRYKQGATNYPYMQPLSGDWLCELDQLGDAVWQDVRVDGYTLPRTIVGGVYAAKRMTQHGQDPRLGVSLYTVDSQGNATQLTSQTFTLSDHSYKWYGVSASVPSGTYKVRLKLTVEQAISWPDSSIIMDNAGLFWIDDVGQLGWANWAWGTSGDTANVVWDWTADVDESYAPEPVALKVTVQSAGTTQPASWGTAADQLVGGIRRGRYRIIIYYKAPVNTVLSVFLIRKKDDGSITKQLLEDLSGTGQLSVYSHQAVIFDHTDRATGILFEASSPGIYWVYGAYLGEGTRYGTILQPLIWVPESRAEYSFRVDNQGPHTIQLDLNKLPTDVRQSITNYGVRSAVVEDDTIASVDEASNYALRYFMVKGAPAQSYQVVLSPSANTPLVTLWDENFQPTNLARLDDQTYRIKRVSYRLEAGQIEQTLDLSVYHPTLEQLFKQEPQSPRRPDLAGTPPVASEAAAPSGPMGAVVVAQTKHNDLIGLQGGADGEYYHLSLDQYTELTSGGNTSLHLHDDRYGRLTADNTWTGVNTYQARVDMTGGSGLYDNPTLKLAPTNTTQGWSHLELYTGWDSTYDYMIGRGTSSYLSGRALTLHIPSRSLYGNTGDYPKLAFVSSGGTTLGWIEADTGNMYVTGKLGVGVDPTQSPHRLKVQGQAVATHHMFVESDGQTYPYIGVQQWTSTGTGGMVSLYRAGGTMSSPAPTPSGGEIAWIRFSGVDTSMTTRTVAGIQAYASSVGSSGIAGQMKLSIGTSSGSTEDSMVVEPGLITVGSTEFRLTGTTLKLAPSSGVPVIHLTSGSGTTYNYANIEWGHGGIRRWNLYKVNNSTVDLALARYDSGGAYQGLSLVVKGDTGIVGIGDQSNPSGSQLYVYNTTTGRYTLRADGITSITSTSAVYDIAAVLYSQETIPSGVTNNGYVMGASILGYMAGSGTLASAYGVRIDVGTTSDSNGTLTTAYGARIRVLKEGANSTISTAYGLYIDPMGGSTTYGIVQAGSNDRNVFYGKVGLGGRVPTTYPLEINGGMYLTGSIEVDGTVDGVDVSGHAANADAHHSKVHLFDGTDHSGLMIIGSKQVGQTLRYSSSGYWYNDYLSHTDLIGVTPDQHHAQVHSLTGSDHTVPDPIQWSSDIRLVKNSTVSMSLEYTNAGRVDMIVYSDLSALEVTHGPYASVSLATWGPGISGPLIYFTGSSATWTLYWTTNGLTTDGRMTASTFATGPDYYWTLGGYTAGAVAVTGYVTVTINGTTYRLLASTV